MSDTFKLQFPTGEFTHTELAQLNKKTNQQVWTRYQQAIKDGVILSAGERKPNGGKGKPSKLWKLNPNPPVPAATPAADSTAPSTPVVTPAAASTPAPEVAKEPTDSVPTEPVVVPAVAPATPPVVETPVVETAPAVEPEVNVQLVTVVEVNPTPEPETASEVVASNEAQKEGAFPLAGHNCPKCKSQLWAVKDATGFMVWCDRPLDVCSTTEAPSGHGSTVKNALQALNDKWGKLLEPATA